MAFPEDVTLNTSDATYPTVTAKVTADGVEAEIDEEYVLHRQVIYQVWDEADVKASHKADLFMDALKGLTTITSFGTFALTNYQPAHRYPGNTSLACVHVRKTIQGVHAPAPKLVETNLAYIHAIYRSLTYPVVGIDASGYSVNGSPTWATDYGHLGLDGEPIPYVTVRKTRSTKTVTIDQSSLKSADSTSPLARGFPLTIPIITYYLTYHKVPWNGDDFDVLLSEKVNSLAIWGKLPESLRYDGSEAEPTGIGGGWMGYDVTVALSWNPRGWNTDIPATKDEIERIVFVDDATKTPYLTADFNILKIAATVPP